jgi:DNA (cytosine-5)-methyltransferase 1
MAPIDFPLAECKIDESMRPKVFSFFSGAGFLDLGFESERYNVVFANELDSAFVSAHQYSRQKLNIQPPEYGYFQNSILDFRKPEMDSLLKDRIRDSRRDGSLVGFIGGPPCPDFSVGGKNKGRQGDRGKLSNSYVDLICHQKPDFFLFENVKGLWSTKRHRRFYEEMKTDLKRTGYRLTERLINCIEYGVPQDRERIILLGFRESVFGNRNGSSCDQDKQFPWTKFAAFPDRRAFDFSWPDTAPFEEQSVVDPPHGVPLELTVEFWFKKNEVRSHPNYLHCFKPRAGLSKFKSVDEGDDSKKSFKRLHRWRYSPTACYGNNEVHLHPYEARRISVSESLAIQSLPKLFELPPRMSLSDMFKTVGNGVPFLAAKMVARSILNFLNNAHEANHVGHSTSDWETTYQPSLQLY